jgi:predicted ATPase
VLLTYADELLALSSDRGLFYTAQTHVIRGWCLAAFGRPEEGTSLLATGVMEYRAGANALHLPLFLTMLADAERMAGQINAGLAHVEEALNLLNATDEKWGEAEILRLRAQLLQASGNRLAAECSFRAAMTLSKQQGAKLFELRACTGLARLWGAQGKRREAQQLLRSVYAWFTEGHEAPDLLEARGLLEELESPSPKSDLATPGDGRSAS